MGEHNVAEGLGEEELRAFMRSLLEDVQALEHMIGHDLIESGIRRVGCEQEMFLIDSACRPAPVSVEVLKHLDDRFTTELARFNLEANLPPLVFGGDCLRRLHEGLVEVAEAADAAAKIEGARVLLSGILPTLQLSDLSLDNMTPNPRYFALNQEMSRLRKGNFRVAIKGVDDLDTAHDNIMLESCNTSFQIHFQVGVKEFAKLYNLAQAVTPVVLAAAVNSPILLGQRLWKETRVALFQQSVDVRSDVALDRGYPQRVSFGERWVRDSVLEIFREDITRFRVVLASGLEEHPMEIIERGEVPPLSALRLHNGTVYRWNRACYGSHGGRAHIRIENRALPAGPTVADEVANAAFFYGLMAAMADEFEDIGKVMPFDEAKSNFLQAAQYGLKAQFTWVDGKDQPAREMILDHFLPTARKGLESTGIDSADVDRYLRIIGDRVETGQTGSVWALNALSTLCNSGTKDQCLRSLTSAIRSRQEEGSPVHTWAPVEDQESDDWRQSYMRVGQFMTRSVFTVRPHDLVNLAASLMEWEHIKHVPVEDDDGNLVGLVSQRAFLRLVARGLTSSDNRMVPVETIMKTDLITATPQTTTVEAIALMRDKRVGCLPVVEGTRLVGIVTEHDFLNVAGRLLEQQLQDP